MFSRIGILSLLVLLMPAAHGGVADYINVPNLRGSDFNFGTWAFGDGDQSITKTFCVASANYSNAFTDPPPVKNPPAVHHNYQFKMIDRSAPTGFFFYLGTDDTNTGNARIVGLLEHRDIKDGNTWTTLVDDVFDSHTHDGQFENCNNGDNSQLRISVNESELEQARAGTYRLRLTMTGQGGSSGTALDSDNFRAQIKVANIVRVSSVNDVNLGYYNSVDIQREETFCVYSNNNNASYEISVSSPNQDVGGQFYLKNVSDTASVPYALSFNDEALGGAGALVGLAAIAGNGNNSSSTCSGADNAKLTIDVLAADMDGVVSDDYSDTLTILVAPL